MSGFGEKNFYLVLIGRDENRSDLADLAFSFVVEEVFFIKFYGH